MLAKIKNGWALAKQCWRVLQLDRELLVFPFLSLIACALVLASFIAPLWFGGFWEFLESDQSQAIGLLAYVGIFAFYFVTYFVIIFFNSALVACALIRFRGGDPTVMDGLRASIQRLPKIFAWAGVSAIVGVLLQALEQKSGWLGKLVASLLGATWAIASYFAVPVLVVENVGPMEALKRSGQMIRKTWGEALTAEFSMSFLVFLAILPGIALLFLAAPLMQFGPVWAAVGVGIGVVWILLVSLASSALSAILKAALYLYAADGKIPHNFDERLARSAFGHHA